MANKLIWFSVRSLYVWMPSGPTKAKDKDYRKSTRMLEERIVLVRAHSFKNAFAKAKIEAKKYVAQAHRNPYGETVKLKCNGDFEAYELFDAPGDLAEVFSATEIALNANDAAATLRAKGTKLYGARERKLRKRFQSF